MSLQVLGSTSTPANYLAHLTSKAVLWNLDILYDFRENAQEFNRSRTKFDIYISDSLDFT